MSFPRVLEVMDGAPWVLHDPDGDLEVGIETGPTRTADDDIALAAELARRWNAHDALVEACHVAGAVLCNCPESEDDRAHALRRINAALAAAREEGE